MKTWRDCKLGDLLQIKHGFAFLGEHFADAGTHIVLTPGNFFDEGGFKHKGDKEKWYNGPIPADYVLNEGDLIVAMTEQAEGLLGSSAIVPRSGLYLHNQRLGLVQIRDREQVDEHFVYYLFNSKPIRQQIRGSASGTKIRHTAPSRIADVKVSIPPLPVQRRIAGILSAYDDVIENNTRRIKILGEMAQAVYCEWFVHFHFPGHERVKLIDSELGEIPTGWEVVIVEQLVSRVSAGKKYETKTVSPTGSVPVLDQGQSGIIGYHNDEPGVVASEDEPIIVFANHACYQRIIQFPFSAIQNVLPFVSNLERHRDIYWLHWATKDLVKFNDYKGHWPEFMSKQLLLPPADLCAEFGRIVKPMVQLTFSLERRNANLRRTRDLLLPKLISGQITL